MASSGLDVRWPGNSTPAGCMLKVALLDHRKYAAEEEAVLRAAERFTAKQDEFYCVFIGLKPIARRLAPPARKAMKVSRAIQGSAGEFNCCRGQQSHSELLSEFEAPANLSRRSS